MRTELLHFNNFSNNIKVNKITFLNLCKGKFNKFSTFKNCVNKKITKSKTKLLKEGRRKILLLKDKLSWKLSLKTLRKIMLSLKTLSNKFTHDISLKVFTYLESKPNKLKRQSKKKIRLILRNFNSYKTDTHQ